MRVWGSFYAQNLRYHLKHKKISPNLAVCSERRQIFQNLNGRFSLNFPDSYMAIRWIISSLAHRNSTKLAQIIHIIAIQLSGKFKENLPFKF